MTIRALEQAVAEARRFIDRAENCKFANYSPSEIEGGSTAAAMKRASLDLTRALAELRRSR